LSNDLISGLGGSNGQVTLADWANALSSGDQTGAAGAAS
jgi:hypothetical protein